MRPGLYRRLRVRQPCGHVARTYIEKLTRVPVCVELASEFRYIDPIITPHTITIVISQSGETLDTLFACGKPRAGAARYCPS